MVVLNFNRKLCKQTVTTLTRCNILCCLTRVCTIFPLPNAYMGVSLPGLIHFFVRENILCSRETVWLARAITDVHKIDCVLSALFIKRMLIPGFETHLDKL